MCREFWKYLDSVATLLDQFPRKQMVSTEREESNLTGESERIQPGNYACVL